MTARFEEGCTYWAEDTGFGPITVLKRTKKMIFVTNGKYEWRMKIREDERGEYAYEHTFDRDWTWAVSFRACYKDAGK